MKKFILPILVCIFLLLCSCSGYLPNKENSGSSAQSVSMPEEDSSSEEQSSSSLESEQPDSGEDVQTQSDTSDSQSVATENSEGSGNQKPPASSHTQVPSNDKEPPKQSQPAEKPEQKPQPSNPEETSPPTSKPTEPSESTPEPSVPEEKPFDISPYLTDAIEYGQYIGLKLDSTATACNDDPIFANADSKFLERDLCDRLNWYVESGFTAFWIWTEDLGNNEYNIFIGYA